MNEQELLKNAIGRLAGLRSDRSSFMSHWAELAEYILPRRYKWTVTPNQTNRGSAINGRIIDSTGTIAARRLASGMMSGITSPTRPWFKLRLQSVILDDNDPASLWLAEVERRMLQVFSESNFYTAMATVYFDLVVFGTGAAILYEDMDSVIRVYTPCAGEYFVANNDQMIVDTMYREFPLTVAQVVRWFGLEACSETVKNLYQRSGAGLETEILIHHAIQPAGNGWLEVYWESGRQDKALRISPFYEFPCIVPRWDLVSNDAYGRGPAMDALGDIKQLQQETKRKAQAIDKMVNPPMVADIQLKNQPSSLIPGGITYIAGTNAKFESVYNVVPPVQELMMDIKEIQNRIGEIFFNDLFLMISNLETVRTATEIDARREEKLVMLGPVLTRFEREALDPAITRTFGIMARNGLIPEPPPEIAGAPLQIQYVSMLAEAQRATNTAAIERLLQLAGNIYAVDQTVMDVISLDDAISIYGEDLNVDPRVLRSTENIMALRQQRAEQVAQAQAIQTMGQAAQGAKVLSETDVGGGVGALQYVLGNA